MKSKKTGPAKFTRGGKTATSALAVTAMIGIWNVIGHEEAASQQVQAAQPVVEQPVTYALDLPPIAPLATPAPIPTLSLTTTVSEVNAAAPNNAIMVNVPAVAAPAPLPTMQPLPALPAMPAPPPPPSNSGGNSGSSSQKSGGS